MESLELGILGESFERMHESLRTHSRRTARYSETLARALGVSANQLLITRTGALLHEIGKLDIPSSILFKPAKLNAEEKRVMRTYPYLGYERVRSVLPLSSAAEIVYAHREKFDGSGYPRGLKENEIPLSAQIIAVACALENFVSDRPHDLPRAVHYARSQIVRCSGTGFDPAIVDVLSRLPDEVLIPEAKTANHNFSRK